MRQNLKNSRNSSHQILENREILSYFDILVLSKCILYFVIFLIFRISILILKFSRIRSQVPVPRREQRGIRGPRPAELRFQEGLPGDGRYLRRVRVFQAHRGELVTSRT